MNCGFELGNLTLAINQWNHSVSRLKFPNFMSQTVGSDLGTWACTTGNRLPREQSHDKCNYSYIIYERPESKNKNDEENEVR